MNLQEKAINDQRTYCADNNLATFIPMNGVCWVCKKQVFDKEYMREKANRELITACPHCHRSFCG